MIYLGSATGRDGIHGATFASEDLKDDDTSKRPNVQIGDPFAEKLLIEATLEALQTGAVHSIQDMGAAGLTCSTIEMSAKGGVGMEVNLDLVPMRESDMSGYELMLSESQERMLCVAHPGREREVIEVFEKWGTHAVVIGTVTADGLVRVTRHGEVIAEVNAAHLADECPTYSTESIRPTRLDDAANFRPDQLGNIDLLSSFEKLVSSPTLASKEWVYRQYDHQVQTQTALIPGAGDAAVLAPRGTKKGLAVKIDGNGRWVNQDPYIGGQLVVCEAARNVACVGGRPVGATDGLNYGNPEIPENYYIFEKSVKGIADACEVLGTPVISGNVSFYNQGDQGAVLPTPMIGMLGLLEKAEDRIGGQFSQDGLSVAAVYYPREISAQEGIGASALLGEVFGMEGGVPEAPQVELEKELCHQIADWAEAGVLDSAHDLSEGGSLFALCEMGLCGIGCSIDLDSWQLVSGLGSVGKLFGEFPGVIFVAFESGKESEMRKTLRSGLVLDVIGSTGGDVVQIQGLDGESMTVSLPDFMNWHRNCIPTSLDR